MKSLFCLSGLLLFTDVPTICSFIRDIAATDYYYFFGIIEPILGTLKIEYCLTLKAPSKILADDTHIFFVLLLLLFFQ